ncbi:MAG: hypothetical protein JW801_19455 [Bacteroidales bacterium]|nr:hypothetical protein [Bacteroidales bacterium]
MKLIANPKYRFFYLLTGIGVVILLAYQVAIKVTVDKMIRYRELKTNISQLDKVLEEIKDLKQQAVFLNARYFNTQDNIENTHEYYLDRLSQIASEKRVSVTEYPSEHVYRNNSLQIETHIISLQGSFIRLLNVLYQLENREKLGRIVSVDFFSETNRRTKLTTLTMQLYIQNYRNLKKYEKKPL